MLPVKESCCAMPNCAMLCWLRVLLCNAKLCYAMLAAYVVVQWYSASADDRGGVQGTGAEREVVMGEASSDRRPRHGREYTMY